ncbi:MAG: hypothetical protein ABL908_18630, partial [Hyphomicrobium sp.]
ASLKYPWGHGVARAAGSKKFGVFQCETVDFDWARLAKLEKKPTVEAALMDYADDIAYSVHDLEDFHRIRAVPWHIIEIDRRRKKRPATKATELIDAALAAWFKAPPDAKKRLDDAAIFLIGSIKEHRPIYSEPYEGTRDQRVSIRNWTSDLIHRYVRTLRPRIKIVSGDPVLVVNPEAEAEIRLLKQITRTFVIDETVIGAQQHGQRKIAKEVFDCLFEDVARHRSIGKKLNVTPKRFHYLMEDSAGGVSNARLVADCISSLTERELIALHQRLTGQVGGSITDPIVR